MTSAQVPRRSPRRVWSAATRRSRRSCCSTNGSISPACQPMSPGRTRRLRGSRQGGRRLLGRRRRAGYLRQWTTAEKTAVHQQPAPQTARPPAWTSSNDQLRLNEAGNNEVLFAWLELAVGKSLRSGRSGAGKLPDGAGPAQVRQAADHRTWPRIAQWGARSQSRIYAKTRPSYHPVTTSDLDKLGLLPTRRNRQAFNCEVTLNSAYPLAS